jgi:cytochrome c-type biogenesis protein CcmH/NrfG
VSLCLNTKPQRHKATKAAIIRLMRLQSWLFLLIGFALGFGGLYTWQKQRAPSIVRAMPLTVDPNVPTDLSSAGQQSQQEAPAPPVDMAKVQELTNKIKQNPKDFDAIVELGNINFDQKNFSDAVSLYQKALQIKPDALNVRTDMGTAMFYQNRFDEAIAVFQETLKSDPKNAQALFNLGVAMLHGKNDVKRAIEYWQQLVDLNPDNPQVAMVKEQIQKLKEQQKQP